MLQYEYDACQVRTKAGGIEDQRPSGSLGLYIVQRLLTRMEQSALRLRGMPE